MAREIAEKIRHFMVKENKIYIMPSGRGLLFLAEIIVLILVGATYNNNLVYILAFFLFGLFFVTMLQTHYLLKGVRLEYISSEEGFEGDCINILFEIRQKRMSHRPDLRVRSQSRKFQTVVEGREDLGPKDTGRPVRVGILGWKRGLHSLPAFILESYYPLGLFRAWKVFRPNGQVTVYPRPDGNRPLQSGSFDYGTEDLGLRTSPEGDFGELKAYLEGESYHQIAWKHYARTGHLYSKVHWGQENRYYIIPWQPRGEKFEAYLRQMSHWVQQALDENANFEMELPNQKIPGGTGLDQARTCWRALALLKGA